MAKCKICGEKINLVIFGCPKDICWGCLNKQEKKNIVENNVNISKKEK